MENKLRQFFYKFIGLIVLLLIGYAAFGPKGKSIDLKEINFTTTASSELYYKNMRSYFYDKEEREDANFLLYRIETRNTDSLTNKLNFVLVSNWLQSECYIIAESKEENIKLGWEFEKEAIRFSLIEKDSEANYIFAATLFEKLSVGGNLFLLTQEKSIPFTEKEKLSLKTTLKDYFKLVGKIR